MKFLICAIILMASFSIASEDPCIKTRQVPTFFADDGCHTETKGATPPDDIVAAFIDGRRLFGARCCKDGNKCRTVKNCNDAGVTYWEAVQACADIGWTLCTHDEILTEMCCRKGGQCDNRAVWTLTLTEQFETEIYTDPSCTEQPTTTPTKNPTDTPTKTPTEDRRVPAYYADDACHTEPRGRSPKDDRMPAYIDGRTLYGARCCTDEGDCITAVNCKGAKTNGVNYWDAVKACEDRGYTLCTKEQNLTEMCCETGGQCDNLPAWILSEPEYIYPPSPAPTGAPTGIPTPYTPAYWVDDGCHEDHTPKDDFNGMWETDFDQKYGVRCCTADTCKTKHKCTEPEGKTIDEAMQLCASFNMDVCTKDQLLSGMCCRQGGQCDHFPVWTSTLSQGRPSGTRWVDEACETEGGFNDDVDGAYFNELSKKFGVRCCDETECVPGHGCRDDDEGKTYPQAVEICSRKGMEVCSRAHLATGMCCGTGGQCDNRPVWTSDIEDQEPKYWADDGCHTEGGITKLDDYIGGWVGESYRFGVRCCSSTACTPGFTCKQDGKTHAEAVAICADMGLDLCSKEQILSEMCCQTGGQCDNRPVWTSTPEFEVCEDLSGDWNTYNTNGNQFLGRTSMKQDGCSGTNEESAWSFSITNGKASITGTNIDGTCNSDCSEIVWTNGVTYVKIACPDLSGDWQSYSTSTMSYVGDLTLTHDATHCSGSTDDWTYHVADNTISIDGASVTGTINADVTEITFTNGFTYKKPSEAVEYCKGNLIGNTKFCCSSKCSQCGGGGCYAASNQAGEQCCSNKLTDECVLETDFECIIPN